MLRPLRRQQWEECARLVSAQVLLGFKRQRDQAKTTSFIKLVVIANRVSFGMQFEIARLLKCFRYNTATGSTVEFCLDCPSCSTTARHALSWLASINRSTENL
jgi:hypothetical protein